jgi:hypothetical protein
MDLDGSAPRGLRCRVVNKVYQDVIAFTLTDESVVQELVVEPLLSAKPDENPARYVVLGYLTVEMDGKESDQVILFMPFGRVKRGDTYLIADFRKLDRYLSSHCEDLAAIFHAAASESGGQSR